MSEVRVCHVCEEMPLPVQAQGLGDVRKMHRLRPHGWPGHASEERKDGRRTASQGRVAIQAYLRKLTMTVKELLDEIKRCKKEYGPGFLDWDIYTEQIDPHDRKSKLERGWETIKDGDGWVYFKCAGFWTKSPKEKAFTVNVNY
ncbi:MAG: hypothetical protein IMZ62_15825 [Chloroflexi bacterium]|nr:hypothetical protein [Chloroflexota bacterium]